MKMNSDNYYKHSVAIDLVQFYHGVMEETVVTRFQWNDQNEDELR